MSAPPRAHRVSVLSNIAPATRPASSGSRRRPRTIDAQLEAVRAPPVELRDSSAICTMPGASGRRRIARALRPRPQSPPSTVTSSRRRRHARLATPSASREGPEDGGTQISLDKICYSSQYTPRQSDNHLRVVLPASPTPSCAPRRLSRALATSSTQPTAPTASRTSWDIEIFGDRTRRVLPGNVKTPSTTSSLASRVLPRRPASQVRDLSLAEH
ncbi:hypothetical protein EV715DRAFT_297900 [Schizophyllum commune]